MATEQRLAQEVTEIALGVADVDQVLGSGTLSRWDQASEHAARKPPLAVLTLARARRCTRTPASRSSTCRSGGSPAGRRAGARAPLAAQSYLLTLRRAPRSYVLLAFVLVQGLLIALLFAGHHYKDASQCCRARPQPRAVLTACLSSAQALTAATWCLQRLTCLRTVSLTHSRTRSGLSA